MALSRKRSFQDNLSMQVALELYRDIESDYVCALRATGIKFAARDTARTQARQLMERLSAAGARLRNGGASVALGPLSRGCVACTGSCTSRTYALSNNCHRDCFFCFNPNQKEFAYYCEHPFPWRKQLDDLAREGSRPVCLALSGGEPLLTPDEAYAFFAYAKNLFPDTHLRLYTAGDLLDQSCLERLREAGLEEIRFSIKQDDPAQKQEEVLANITMALDYIPTVMVEMPSIPGTEDQMRELLCQLDARGVHGINLLEFIYSMWNWPVFESLGLTLRNPPYRVFFDYSYAGSLAVQGSEELCLRLMLWAQEKNLKLGMHYCSLENKHRAQVRTVNEPHKDIDARYAFDYGDYFIKTVVAFGPDRSAIRAFLRTRGCREFLEDDRSNSLSFHPKWLPGASRVHGCDGALVQLCVSSNIVVEQDGQFVLRELKIEQIHDAAPFQLRECMDQDGDTIVCEMKRAQRAE
ncbi:MAG: radical SAM protein [Gordonibacter sp.]